MKGLSIQQADIQRGVLKLMIKRLLVKVYKSNKMEQSFILHASNVGWWLENVVNLIVIAILLKKPHWNCHLSSKNRMKRWSSISLNFYFKLNDTWKVIQPIEKPRVKSQDSVENRSTREIDLLYIIEQWLPTALS